MVAPGCKGFAFSFRLRPCKFMNFFMPLQVVDITALENPVIFI
jgi:hypothetical protein